jgi:hypothetical protein
MRIVVVLRRPSLVRYFESTLDLLAERGHNLDLIFSELVGKGNAPPDLERVEALSARFPTRISYSAAPEVDPANGWRGIAGTIRMWGDFTRFLHPRFAEAPRLRRRLADRVEPRRGAIGGKIVSALVARLERVQSARAAAAGAWLGRRLEEAIPVPRELLGFLESRRPDAVVVTPLIDAGSDQVEFIKAARELGIPSAAAIASWDNLSSKGLIRIDPDRVFVWNDVQVDEAVHMHGLARARVIPTGAPRFDPWFDRHPSRSARELAEVAGLNPARRYLLYLCSSAFIAPEEPSFVARWLAAVRADSELADLGVLIRPHPQNAWEWRVADLSRHSDVVIWPPNGENVDDESSRAIFYDSLSHSLAVVGINTSALIEAAIAGKVVYTVVDETFRETQVGTLHYHYLRHENGGFLHEAATLDEHVAQLRAGIRGTSADLEQTERFVAGFVRPRGLGRSASQILADEIEGLERIAPDQLPSPSATKVFRLVLRGIAAVRRRRRRSLAVTCGTVRS